VQGKFGQSGLAAVVSELCTKAGLSETQYDVSRLQDRVEGFIIAKRDSARGLLEQLMSGYFFDAVERDGVLTFLPRGQASSLTIQAEDIAQDAPIEITRQQEPELPQRIELQYLNRLHNYEAATQAASRHAVDTQAVDRLALPLVFSDQRARSIAEVALQQAWLGRVTYRLTLPVIYSGLEPGDVFTLQDDTVQHVLRIQSLDCDRNGRLHVEAVAEDAVSYQQLELAGGEEATPPSVEPVVPIPATTSYLLDLPAMQTDAPDAAMLRAAAMPVAEGWQGAAIFRSDDGGGSYAQQFTFRDPCVVGTAASLLGQGPRNRFDEVSRVEILLQGTGTLSGIDEAALLNGANLAMLGEEVFQFQHTELISPNKYRLSRLLRGRLGTEHAIATHSLGERFILLDARLQKDMMPDGLIGLPRQYKTVSVGRTLGVATPYSFTYQARSLKPYSPVHVTDYRNEVGDLRITWKRRTRIGGNWRDYSDVPLSEQEERYVLELLDGEDILRSIEVTQPEYLYTSAQQLADFGVVPAPLSVRVMQLSARVGRGYPTMATV